MIVFPEQSHQSVWSLRSQDRRDGEKACGNALGFGSVLIISRDGLTTVSIMLRVVYSIQIIKPIAVDIIGNGNFLVGFTALVSLS